MESSNVEIIKSKSDKRIYKHIVLPNKLEAMIISDPDADKSAAALDVKVGCSLDPKEGREKPLFGNAHFLEHMLFQGTEKYPSESEYSSYISNNGGMNNAFTSLTDTNYQFDCSNEGFEGALDRFSQFFICPSFTADSTDREMNAVDSEFNQSLQSDAWKYFHLTQHIANPDSNMCRFNCGNKESL
jgi:insulysin